MTPTLRGGAPVPPSPLPLLPLRGAVLLPGSMLRLDVGRVRSVALLRAVFQNDIVAVGTQKNPRVEDPSLGDLHATGTYARLVNIGRKDARTFRITLEGLGRFTIDTLAVEDPYWKVDGRLVPETRATSEEAKALADALRQQLSEADDRGLQELARSIDAPEELADRVAAALGLSNEAAMQVLLAGDVPERLRLVLSLFIEAKERAEVRNKVDQDVRRELHKHQREAILREQLRAIQKELGDSSGTDLDALKKRLDDANLPEEARKVVDRELTRLETIGDKSMESNVIRTYLEWFADLPWSKRAHDVKDAVASDATPEPEGELIDRISQKLDEDHEGLDDVKKRILEHFAVQELSGNTRGTILCLAGPPGVGKTSLGESIASATGRPFVRISLGGVRDEAEIRGHRRTYVGALPGRILHALRKAGVKDPVILLDEIDKLGAGWQGNPEDALLEVLDPEQNRSFVDHYLEAQFDLSEVLFICTANTLDRLSPPLRDRLEIIELSGYTTREKVKIARRHLLPKRVREHGIPDGALDLTDSALDRLIADYTREAGVRQLSREITKVCRAVALTVAKSKGKASGISITVDDAAIETYLGKAKFRADVAERTSVPGVATGLAWTPVGGDILFIETSRMPGKGRLEITGQLGDVMKESARAALTYVRSHASELGVNIGFETDDLHIHVPAGAVPKDGPSAGVTMFTALASLLSGRRVRPNTAMTGECTLRGRVLPVGGIKDKVLAAHRAGITRVILPIKNRRDLDEVPVEVRDSMEFVLVEDMRQVLDAALEDNVAGTPDASDSSGQIATS